VLDNSEERETSATLSSYDSDSNDMSLEALGHITQGLSFLPITYESLFVSDPMTYSIMTTALISTK
jgi:hypothetical protein